jgi:H+/Cl- antiporter ClcA
MERIVDNEPDFTSWMVWKRRLVFGGGAIAIGCIAAGFALLSTLANDQFLNWYQIDTRLPFLVTPLGFAVISLLTVNCFPNAQGSGIPQTIAALEESDHAKRQQLLSLKIAIGKVLLCCLAILCGASMGREGPTVHIGASILFWIGGCAHFPKHDIDKGLILAGGAAGVAAAFNTPLAGIVFAIEELGRSFDSKTSNAVITAVLLAGTMAIFILGRYTHFGQSNAMLSLNFIGIVIVLKAGIACGVVGGIFGLLLIKISQWVGPLLRRHAIMIPLTCGLVVAFIGYLMNGDTFGTGYRETQYLMEHPGQASFWYPFAKMASMLACAISGLPGGFFSPSLATGAGLGATLAFFFPPEYADVLVLLGMVGFFSGMVQAPITAFVIIMEMTDNQEMLLPLMGTAFVAYGVSKFFCPEPVYNALAKSFLGKSI